MRHIILLITIFTSTILHAQTITISGTITDARTGEALIGVGVSCKEELKGTVTNVYGFYSVEVKVPCSLTFSYLGYEEANITVTAEQFSPLNIQLTEKKNALNEVVVQSSRKENDLQKTQAGYTHIDIKQISTIPVLGGEKDVIKVLQLMPGIKRGSDGSTSMLVRGGSGDQNLVLIDEAPVYNASHLLGFFSVFNSDALKDVSMQKGGFTANYGGRLSSVLDVRMKEGNMKKMEVNAGIGLLSARASIEGPILKDRMSFIVSARRTYIDHVYKLVDRKLPFYFYDLNAKINLKLSEQNRFFISAYTGKDVLKFGGDNEAASSSTYDADFGTTLGNSTVTARWNHVYPDQKLFQNTSLIYSRFNYILKNRIGANEMQIISSIEDYSIKSNYDYYLNNSNHLRFGGEITQHHFRPNISKVKGRFNESIKPGNGQNLHTQEMALYALNEQFISSRWNANYGLRLSGATTPQTAYWNLEPRVNLTYQLTSTQTLKAAYSHMSQYINLVAGSSTMPTDLWYPVSENIKPQTAKQITFGYTKEWSNIHLLFSAEGYYKWMNNLVEYKEGTIALLNDNIEQDLVQGKGKAWGIELMLHKQSGRWNGWIGYTLSYSKRQFNELNKGKEFYARYDRRHDISVVSNVDLTKRMTLSAVWTFATGSRFTPVTGQFLMPNGSYTDIDAMPIYSNRNAVVLSASHRLDVNLVIRSKAHKKYSSEWHIGAYNVYNRTQPFRIKIVKNDDGSMNYKQVGLFGFIPSIAYNIKF
jgi:hypothetical protein